MGSTQTPGISKERARSGLTNIQSIMGLLLLLSAAAGFYLLATDGSLWNLALSHAVGLIVIVVVDLLLGLMNLASSRGAYLPGLAAAVLGVVLQLGDILTAPQYYQTVAHFASYLFGLGAFDLLLGLQVSVIVLGAVGRPYARYLARRKSRRGRELDYTRRGFMKNIGVMGALVGLAAVLSTVKLPVSSVLQSTTTTEIGAPAGSIARESNLAVDSPVYFEYPTGYPNMLIRHADGSISALSLLCTHVCCEVTFEAPAKEFYCPCHGSIFDSSGKVLQGPALVDLPQVLLSIDNNGYIFPTGVSNPGPCQA